MNNKNSLSVYHIAKYRACGNDLNKREFFDLSFIASLSVETDYKKYTNPRVNWTRALRWARNQTIKEFKREV